MMELRELLYIFFESILERVNEQQVLLDCRNEARKSNIAKMDIDLFQKRLAENTVERRKAKWRTKILDYICDLIV